MANCADDLTSIDVSAATPGSIASTSTSSSTSLFPFILHNQSSGINLDDPSHLVRVLRPLDSKDTVKTNEEIEGVEVGEGGVWTAGCLDSQDGDDEIILRIQFSELVRIKSILIGTGGGRDPLSSQSARLWVNLPSLISFSDVHSTPPAQDFELLDSPSGSTGSIEYPVRISKFANVSSVDVFLSGARGGERSRLFYLGFLGEAKVLKKDLGDGMAIGAQNTADSLIDGVKEEKRGAHAVK